MAAVKASDKIISMEEAVNLVKDGDTIWINSFGAVASPVNLNMGLTKRFRETGHPRHLSVYSAFSFSDWEPDSDVEGYICEGAADRVVIGFFGTLKRTCQAIMDNKIEGYNLPGGVMSHMIRAGAMGWDHLLTKVGLNLFVDPKYGQYKLNEKSKLDLVRRVTTGNGVEALSYDIPKVDIAFLKATYADERGNISFQNEGASVDALSVAQAAHRNGGKVIVQVMRLVNRHMPPRQVEIPSALVDAVVICPEQQQLTTLDGYFDYLCGNYVPTGNILKACREEIREHIGATSARNDLHKAIAKRAYHELVDGEIVNIGIGIPELIADEVLANDRIDAVHLSVEAGSTGGFPLGGRGFGCAIGPDTILDMARQFDFYEGGGLDACFIGALEIDKNGNVNGHYTKGKLSGIGGFANISQTTKKVVFCCTFSAKGLKGTFDGKEVHITQEGSIKKFVPELKAMGFSEANAKENRQTVMYITERCVFVLGEDGLVLTEIAPGIDLHKDILDQLEFDVKVADELKLMEF
ncbi:MAG: propionate CoA-transferase [Lachnospiraceae bacterium]|nr:propionate CoA-transferase [Lachnospiraceae bacterium]